ncbi:MAG: glycosyltransferase family 39 protein [Candidatus Omnitrophota bacterium]
MTVLKKYSAGIILTFIFIFHVGVNYLIMKQSSLIHVFDEGHRVIAALEFSEMMSMPIGNAAGAVFLKFKCLDVGQGHPHLFELVEACVWQLLVKVGVEDIEGMILIVNAGYMLILLWSTFGIGRIIYDKRAGLLAAFLLSMFPLVFGLSRQVMLDFPLMCMVTLSIYFLFKTNQFVSRRYSILFGLTFGLAQLTKEAAVIFIAVPLIYYFIKACFSGCGKRGAVNFFIAMMVFIVVSSVVFLDINNLKALGLYMAKLNMDHRLPFVYYFKEFWGMAGPYGMVVVVFAFISYCVHIRQREWFLFIWSMGLLLLFSFCTNKILRFIVPIAPAVALIVAGELVLVRSVVLRRVYVLGVILIVLMQYVACNTGYILSRENFLFEKGQWMVERDGYWKVVHELLLFFKQEGIRQGSVMSFLNNPSINHALALQFSLSRWKDGSVQLALTWPAEWDEAMMVSLKKKDWEERVLDFDYVLMSDRETYVKRMPEENQLSKELKDIFLKHKEGFSKIASMDMGDGAYLEVYRKVKSDEK